MLDNDIEIKNNKTDEVRCLTEGMKFAVPSPQGVYYFKIENYEPTCIMKINLEQNVTAERSYTFNKKVSTTQKAMAKILYIEDDEVGIEVYLEEGKTQSVLNKFYVDILRKKELLYCGAEFDILHVIDDDGTSTKILNRSVEKSTEVDNFYEDLIKNLG